MNGLTVAVTTYIIAIVISFFRSRFAPVDGAVLTRFSKDKVNVNRDPVAMDIPQTSSDNATIAAVIAIAKNVG